MGTNVHVSCDYLRVSSKGLSPVTCYVTGDSLLEIGLLEAGCSSQVHSFDAARKRDHGTCNQEENLYIIIG